MPNPHVQSVPCLPRTRRKPACVVVLRDLVREAPPIPRRRSRSAAPVRDQRFGPKTHPVFGDVSFVINQTDMASLS